MMMMTSVFTPAMQRDAEKYTCRQEQKKLNCVRGEHKPARFRSFATVTLILIQ